MITDLYKVYSEYHDEPFDKFYFWGEMLLGDFDLIDKYMIDADMLFRNIYDLKVLEADLSYLTPEMRRIISTFWSHFKDEESLSEEKRKFLSIWKTLAAVYHGLRKRLADAGGGLFGYDVPFGGRECQGRKCWDRSVAAVCVRGIQCSVGERETCDQIS